MGSQSDEIKVVLPRSIPIDLICMVMILRLAFSSSREYEITCLVCFAFHTLRFLTSFAGIGISRSL
jgi:hypothetical protein